MKRLLPVLMGFVVLLGMQQAQAFDPEHLKRLKETNFWGNSTLSCPKCNLVYANLEGADLKGADLRGANLYKANLQGAKLQGANLQGANLLGAELDPEGIKIARASGAINVPEAVVTAKKPSPTVTAKKSLTKRSSLPACPGSPLTGSISDTRMWNNCEGTFIFGNKTRGPGNKYVGQFKDGKPYGQGTVTFGPKSKWAGGKYVGEFNVGNYQGQGTFTYPNGDKYVGEFKYGLKDGQGTQYYADGRVEEGIWEYGALKSAKKTSPTVIAKKSPTKGSSLPACPGSPTDNRDTPKNWTNCVGTYFLAAGTKYVGEYRNGKLNGQGTFTSGDNKYVGEFKYGFFNGQGTFYYPEGKYVGEYKKGLKHGQGTYTWSDGDKYVGEWKDGTFWKGHGTYTWSSGNKYVGQFKNGTKHGQGTFTFPDGRKYVGEWKNDKGHGEGAWTSADGSEREGLWENGKFKFAKKPSPTVIGTSEKTPKVVPKKIPSIVAKATPKKTTPKPPAQSISASGFFVSKLGHVITNEHVVRNCKSVTVGDNANKQSPANIEETDRRNDLALLKLSTLTMASVETKSLIAKLGIKVVPLASDGLLRSEDVELGERIMVSGYPFGDIFSNTIKVTTGIVSAVRGMGDDSSQFTMDAAVQKGSSGGPIYDENGNVVGVVVAKLDREKVAKRIGSMPENMNFGIKASTVRQFLTSSGLPTKWSTRSKSMSTKELAKIAQKQTLMVMCQQ